MEPINKISVVNEVVKRITDSIIKRELKPGNKIPTEIELCERLGVGRNSLREAIKMLSALGVLEIRRGDGTYIAEKISSLAFDTVVYSVILEESTPEEILELRKTLDIDVLKLAVSKATAEDIALLDNIQGEYRELIDKKNYEEAVSKELKFHFALIDAAKNPLLARIVKGVYNLFWVSLDSTLKNRQEYIGACQKHEEIIDVIKRRDKSRIPEVIERSHEVWKEYWTDQGRG